MTAVSLGGRKLGDGEPAFVLAELASAHQGEADEAIALARLAKESGADGVKFQLFRSGELIAPDDARREVFDRIELGVAEWERVLGAARELEMPVLADVFDLESLAVGERGGVAAYKIHSTDMENPDFVRRVAAAGKPVLLATGGYGHDAIERALELVRGEGNESIVLLHGVQNFPTSVADSHLRYLPALKERFGLPVGFLDHVDGGSEIALVLPALALAFGADLVEKHLTRDRAARGFDYESSLDGESFVRMVSILREAEASFGSEAPPAGASAARYHRLMRRAVLSGVELPAGERLRRDQVVFLRSESGLAPGEVDRILGRRPRRRVPAYRPLTEEMFDD